MQSILNVKLKGELRYTPYTDPCRGQMGGGGGRVEKKTHWPKGGGGGGGRKIHRPNVGKDEHSMRIQP